MASYYDEHDCSPLGEGEQPNHTLHLARLLIDSGYARQWNLDFESVFSGGSNAPPASKKFVEELPEVTMRTMQGEERLKCPICLIEYSSGEQAKQLPCKHTFHARCILPWLERTNSCPFCRYELPTDNPEYEELKRQKARQKQREFEIEALHDSMYG